MCIFDLTTVEANTCRIDAELCVIGAGIAGLILARRIANSGRKVVVVESGKASFDKDIHQLNALAGSHSTYSRAMDGRYRALGGSSTRWGGRIIPLNCEDTKARDYLDLQGWPIDIQSLDVYTEEIENLFSVAHGGFEDEGGMPGWPILPPSETMVPRWAKCPSFKRCNLGTTLLEELKRSENLDVWLDATIVDFQPDFENGRLGSVTARNLSGKELTVCAENFVLAAGTIETTRLMLVLDQRCGFRISDKSHALGHYFQDHLKLHVASIDRTEAAKTNSIFAYRYLNSTRRDLHLELSKLAQIKARAGSAFAYIAMDLTNSPLAQIKKIVQSIQQRKPDLKEITKFSSHLGTISAAAYWRFIKKQLYVPANVELKIMICAEQLPNYANEISLSRECDAHGTPKAVVHWKSTQSENRTFAAAVAQLAEFWKRGELNDICPLVWKDGINSQTDFLSQPCEACAHPSGTTKMGSDPSASIVSPDLWCHEIQNLAVISASVFPTAGSANPTFTLMKLAYRFADHYIKNAGPLPRNSHVSSEVSPQPVG